jgi:hypothetical protein
LDANYYDIINYSVFALIMQSPLNYSNGGATDQ